MASPPLNANSTDPGVPAIVGEAVGTALLGHSTNGPGVSAESDHFDACIANCHSATNSAVAAVNNAGGFGVRGLGKRGVVGESVDADGIGIFGKGGRLAGHFEGNVKITGALDGGTVTANVLSVTDSLTVNKVEFKTVVEQINILRGDISHLSDNVSHLPSVGPLTQQINSLQQQVSSLQAKQASDVAGIANSLITLAARVTALGG